MRITVKQRGGFAGVDVDLAQLDTATLDAAKRTAVEQQVHAVLSSAERRDVPVGADLLEYELTVDNNGDRQVRTWRDDGTDAAAPIRDLVTRIADMR